MGGGGGGSISSLSIVCGCADLAYEFSALTPCAAPPLRRLLVVEAAEGHIDEVRHACRRSVRFSPVGITVDINSRAEVNLALSIASHLCVVVSRTFDCRKLSDHPRASVNGRKARRSLRV